MNDQNLPSRCTLQGPHAILRGPCISDQADRQAAGNDPEFIRMLGLDPDIVPALTDDSLDEWYRQIQDNPLHWMVEYHGRCVGSARLHHVDWRHLHARYAVAFFDRSVWNRGIGTEVTRLVLSYAFETLHLHRVRLRVLEDNGRAIRAYEKAGFKREGVEREIVLIGDAWHNDVIMGVLDTEYREAAQGWPEFPSSYRIL